ncbi:5'-nucleotidase C-terminal domain-containing protein [Metabacillus litoralis]|uniref:5'-nucleotidase C-terminal domain-containing protein n=1 Tax=Metabacillus litoralis TaxID=152268 RepID=UPI00203F7C47|nr:5'-nucleotidase C-terminal domain-containing protein [Metabacillus litoralis]MCM3162616.1 5'-nucleotidase C-terminal domain-containing protein [Metabacillus litoralis]
MQKKNVTKLIVPSVLATAAFIAAAPSQAEAASSTSNLVKQAQLSANQLVKFYNVKNSKDLSYSKEFKNAYEKATSDISKADKAVQSLKNGPTKNSYKAQLETAKSNHLRAARVIDAIKVGNELSSVTEKLNTYVKSQSINANMVQAYHDLSSQIRKAERVFSKVYGEDHRNKIRDTFLVNPKIVKESVIYEVSAYILQDEITKLIDNNKMDAAKEAFAKLSRLEKRAVEIKEAGNKLHPGKYPSLAKIEKILVDRKEKISKALPTNFTLSLMHTNDTHAHLDNVAKSVTAVKEVRAKNPDALLVNAGDVFSGTLYFNEFEGQADLEFMNLMQYDVMTFGNHEFDLGSTDEGHQALVDFIKGAKFPFVSSNVNFSADSKFTGLFSDLISSEPENGKIYNGMIKEVNGEKVGFFGLTTAETADISSPGKVKFEDYIEEAEKAVKAFEGKGVNKIVAITHIGYDDNPEYDNDLELAAHVAGIDVIVGGHSHTKLEKPVVITKDENGKAKDPTVIVQGYQYNEILGTLDVEFDENGKVIGQAGELISIDDKAEDPEAAKMLKKYSDKIAEVKNTPTGGTAVEELANPRAGENSTISVRNSETPLGNLITDGMLDKAKQFNSNVVIAMQNGGGIRAAIDKGEITLGDVLTTLPFGNTLATIELTGAEIKEALEHSISQAPKESGGFLHVSGMKYTYDSTKPAGSRVQTIEVKGSNGNYAALSSSQTYTIATNAFTAKGGDGYDVFSKAYAEGRVTDLGVADWENLRDYVKKLGTVNPKIENRIVDVKGTVTTPTTPTTPSVPSTPDPTPDNFSGTVGNPKTYNGETKVDFSNSNITKLENAVIKGDLILTGAPTGEITFSNIKVEGNLNLSNLNGAVNNLVGIEVDGETTF